MPHHLGPHETTWARQKVGEGLWTRAQTVVSTGNNGKTGEAGFGLASLNNLRGLCSVGTVPRCLVPGPSD